MSDDPWDTDSLQDLAREVRLDPDPAPVRDFTDFNPGIDLDDYFAAAALTGLLAFPGGVQYDPAVAAAKAFAYARAMLRERRKT